MSDSKLVACLKHWQVALMVLLLVASAIAIGPRFEDGKFTTNLQYGLDLQEGTWLQMEFKAEVVGFETDRAVEDFVADLQKQLDAEIYLIDENKLEIRGYYPEETLRTIFSAAGGRLTTYEQGVSRETADDVKRILENKLNALGTKDARVNPLTGLSGVSHYIRVELAGVSLSQAKEIVGTQGKFEIRIHTTGNQTEHVLYGDTITTVGVPSHEPPGSPVWGVSFTLSEEGARKFQQGAIATGAVSNPDAHYLDMVLDGNVVYSAPLSADLAAKLAIEPIRQLYASTGTGAAGLEAAKNLEIHLRAGALPVDVTVAGSGYVPAALSDYFRMMCVVAFIAAAIAVGVVIFYRYREPSIVLPMIGSNLTEIVILLGIATLIQQLDLAAIAALIAVMGTGIDQLVIITDEILHEGKVPSPTLYKKRLARALGIILVSAFTVIFAMIPLALMDLSSLRGFALITIIGVVIGVAITRPAYGEIIKEILSK
ncbi:MAG TPA: preprotein translocase subunit SecD [Methanolinea sp.]|nr:preprotein translocase subunit SecD [Methanolinea sp.]HQK56548.1 preprotein translocase subunit SecD [Methanolinea sp.]